jgi:hypothetical protein
VVGSGVAVGVSVGVMVAVGLAVAVLVTVAVAIDSVLAGSGVRLDESARATTVRNGGICPENTEVESPLFTS